jgi:hypothetical protein
MRILRKLKLAALSLFAFGAITVLAHSGGDMKVMATLVWGTDEEKPNVEGIKPLNAEIAKQLKPLKWKHYFEITNVIASLSDAKTNRIRLSPKCELDVANRGKMGLNAKFYGEGKLIYEGTSIVEPGNHWTIAGDSKDATAWLVILTPQVAEKK